MRCAARCPFILRRVMPRTQDVLALVPPSLAGARGVHVVGGAVRDDLIGRETSEIDCGVECEAAALARRVGEDVVVHDRFGTATARVDGTVVDLASARREHYPRPGALPEVVF